MNKQKILDNVKEYSAGQLVEYIQEGIVTFDEIVQDTDGEFDPPKRREVKRLLENGDSEEWRKVQQERTIDAVQRYLDKFANGQYRELARSLKKELVEEIKENELKSAADEVWTTVDKNNLNSLRSFINSYPDSRYVNEANTLINNILLDEIMGVDVETLVNQIRQLQTQKGQIVQNQIADQEYIDNNTISTIERFFNEKKITKNDLLEKIQEDPNLLSAGVVKRLINSGTLSMSDLVGIGINRLFIQRMFNGESAQSFSTPEKLDRIHKQSTEIYFWGIPSSGKSCALGAILSVAASGRIAKSMDPDTGSQGYGYMTKLINLFHNGEVGTLMEGTAVDSFYEMGFDLLDVEGRIHPITCIDMAGELMRCMYKANAGDKMNEIDEVMLDTLTRVLIDNRSTSRKMHIFVIEYGAEDRLYEGLPQKVYLDGALSYIKNTGIFKKDTDAIYIMITKADKVKNATKETFNQYINDKYLGFYNGLEQICKDNEINKGRVEKLAFSLGEVCFQNYCKFDSRPAENVVNLILQRSASYRGGKRGKLEKIFRG
jgi:hypothetical protein